MNVPNIYRPEELAEHVAHCQKQIGKHWVPARPVGLRGLFLRERLRAAWEVFTGRWDVVRWVGQ